MVAGLGKGWGQEAEPVSATATHSGIVESRVCVWGGGGGGGGGIFKSSRNSVYCPGQYDNYLHVIYSRCVVNLFRLYCWNSQLTLTFSATVHCPLSLPLCHSASLSGTVHCSPLSLAQCIAHLSLCHSALLTSLSATVHCSHCSPPLAHVWWGVVVCGGVWHKKAGTCAWNFNSKSHVQILVANLCQPNLQPYIKSKFSLGTSS